MFQCGLLEKTKPQNGRKKLLITTCCLNEIDHIGHPTSEQNESPHPLKWLETDHQSGNMFVFSCCFFQREHEVLASCLVDTFG